MGRSNFCKYSKERNKQCPEDDTHIVSTEKINNQLNGSSNLVHYIFFISIMLLSLFPLMIFVYLSKPLFYTSGDWLMGYWHIELFVVFPICGLSGISIILLEQHYAQKHHKKAKTKKHPVTPRIPNPLVCSHDARRNKLIIVLNKINPLYGTNDSKYQTSNEQNKPNPLAHFFASFKRIIKRLKGERQP
jgi:hypothetical protein